METGDFQEMLLQEGREGGSGESGDSGGGGGRRRMAIRGEKDFRTIFLVFY